MTVPDKITFRPGNLAGPLVTYCDKHGLTPSAAVRKALSEMLEKPEPSMDGNVKNLRQYREARCKHCGKKTMHMGDVCYSCNQRRESS